MTDQHAQARAHEIFDPIAADFLSLPGVDIGRMFGSEGLRIRSKVFALVDYDGRLMLKLPESRVNELDGRGGVERIVMRGRPMREWLTVPPESAERWPGLVGEAHAFVDSITP